MDPVVLQVDAAVSFCSFGCSKPPKSQGISKNIPEDALCGHPEQLTPSQGVCTLRQESQLHCPISGSVAQKWRLEMHFFKRRLGFLCLILGQDSFTVGGSPSAKGDGSLSSCCRGEWMGRRIYLLLSSLYEQPKRCPRDGYVWVTHVFWKSEPCSLHQEERAGSWLAAGRNTAPADTPLRLLPALKSHQPSCSTLNRQL